MHSAALMLLVEVNIGERAVSQHKLLSYLELATCL